MWNLDFEEKCINFVEQVYSDLQRVAFLFSSPWKSGDFSFDVRKITLEEEKITLEEVFFENLCSENQNPSLQNFLQFRPMES